jgi:hypothetical protein
MKPHELEDELHKLARKANQRGLSIKQIGRAFFDRAKFTTFLPERGEYPVVFSDETARKRLDA